MATTFSLLAVFLPVGFMGGIVGRFMSSFGFTSAFAIAVSLLVSFTLTPMLTSRFVRPPKKHLSGPGDHGHSSRDSRLYSLDRRRYTRMLKWAMAHRGLMLAFSALTVISIVPLFMFVGKNFLPAGRSVAVQCAGKNSGGFVARRDHGSGRSIAAVSASCPVSPIPS